jgi:hypothetical protein
MAGASGPAGLIDTDILIDASHRIADAVNFMVIQQAAGIRISIISAMELVAGSRNAKELAEIKKFLQRVTVLPVNPAASQMAYQLMESFFLGHGLLIADSLIAATALEHGLTLYTKNTRHFRMIPNLTVVRPY